MPVWVHCFFHRSRRLLAREGIDRSVLDFDCLSLSHGLPMMSLSPMETGCHCHQCVVLVSQCLAALNLHVPGCVQRLVVTVSGNQDNMHSFSSSLVHIRSDPWQFWFADCTGKWGFVDFYQLPGWRRLCRLMLFWSTMCIDTSCMILSLVKASCHAGQRSPGCHPSLL